MAVMLARGDLALEADIRSDTAPLGGLVETCSTAAPVDPLAARPDPGRRRHGLQRAGPGDTNLAVVLDEATLPVDPAVNGACDLLGIDPLYVANEGKLVAVVAAGRGRRRAGRAARPPARCRGDADRRDPRRPGGHRRAADRVRRHPDRRHAGRRPAAPDLLTGRIG